MITYQLLDGTGMAEVARERVLELEREHYRLRLLLGEVTERPDAQAALVGQLTEIERRHAVHTEPAPAPEDGGEPAPPAPEPAKGEPVPDPAPVPDTDTDPRPETDDARPRALARASRNGHASR